MNHIRSETPVNSRAKNFWGLMPYTKEFRYTVQLTMDECLTRLYRLQPSLTVSITQNTNQARFEICVKRYEKRNTLQFVYKTAVAYGIVMASPEHPEMMIIEGIARYKFIFWLYLFVLASFIFMTALTGYIIFGLLGLVLCLIFIRRDYNDYRKLNALIHETFSDRDKIVSEHK